MATYIELRRLMTDSDLPNKVEVATIVAAEALISGTPTASETLWAASVFANPKGESKKALMGVIAINKDATLEAIQSASDTAVQSAVDSLVQTLVTAHAGV